MEIKDEYGTTYISVRREKDKIRIQIDSCIAVMKPKEAKKLIDEIRNAILGK